MAYLYFFDMHYQREIWIYANNLSYVHYQSAKCILYYGIIAVL